jgi:hypothetical protein
MYHVTPVENREFIKAPSNVERRYFLSPMCHVSKRTMHETTGVFVRGSEFMIASINVNRLLDDFL